MKNISLQYQDLQEGKMTRHQFLRNARMMFPNHVTQFNSFEDSVTILKSRGLLNEGNAVKGTPDKAPEYDYPTQPGKYMKVVQEPEVDEQDGIYPATTVTDIPKEEVSKPVKDKSDGLEPIKPHDKKNEMKKIRIVKENAGTEDKEKFDPKQHQKDDLKKFAQKIINQVQGGPATKVNTLRDKIKEMVREALDEMYDEDVAEFDVDTERFNDDEKPRMSQLMDIIVNKFIDYKQSNDINLADDSTESELQDVIDSYLYKIGYGINDDYYNILFYGVKDELRRQGINFV